MGPIWPRSLSSRHRSIVLMSNCYRPIWPVLLCLCENLCSDMLTTNANNLGCRLMKLTMAFCMRIDYVKSHNIEMRQTRQTLTLEYCWSRFHGRYRQRYRWTSSSDRDHFDCRLLLIHFVVALRVACHRHCPPRNTYYLPRMACRGDCVYCIRRWPLYRFRCQTFGQCPRRTALVTSFSYDSHLANAFVDDFCRSAISKHLDWCDRHLNSPRYLRRCDRVAALEIWSLDVLPYKQIMILFDSNFIL